LTELNPRFCLPQSYRQFGEETKDVKKPIETWQGQ
jgi:hypothetical protein